MSSFQEVRFPADIPFKAKSELKFQTEIISNAGNFEKRNSQNSTPRRYYEIDYKNISQIESEKLRDFFIARKGSAIGFRFKDWQDYQAQNQQIGVGDNIKTDFQLIKIYGDETSQISRKINKISSNPVVIYFDGIQQNSGFSVDNNNGLVNFSTPPADEVIITADFEFDVPVRFSQDIFTSSAESFSKNSVEKIELIEVGI